MERGRRMRILLLLVAVTGVLVAQGKGAAAAPGDRDDIVIAQTNRVGEKGPAGQRREAFTNIISVFLDDVDAPESRISLGIRHQVNPNAVSGYAETKKQRGTYSRTQFNVLLCEQQPCEQQWVSSFIYTDEDGKKDKFSITWKQIVFEGMTPAGTSKRELLYCVNSDCRNLEETARTSERCVQLTPDNHCKSVEASADLDAPLTAAIGRYQLTWRKTTLIIRRADVAP